MIVPVEDLSLGLNLEHNFNLPVNLQNDNADDGDALVEDPLGNFQDSGFPAISPTQNNNGRALVEDLSSNYELPDFDLVPIDNKDFGFEWFDDPLSDHTLNSQQRQYHNDILRSALTDDKPPHIVFKDSHFSLATSSN